MMTYIQKKNADTRNILLVYLANLNLPNIASKITVLCFFSIQLMSGFLCMKYLYEQVVTKHTSGIIGGSRDKD